MPNLQTWRTGLTLGLVVCSTVLGLLGTDFVLPAIPSLLETRGGDAAAVQFVLAAYVGGTSIGSLPPRLTEPR